MSQKNRDRDVLNIVVDSLQKIDSKLDRLDERLDSAEKVAIKQEHNLELHMKRSDLLEKSQNELKEYVKPILKAYTVLWGITKIVGSISVLVGIATGIVNLINKLK